MAGWTRGDASQRLWWFAADAVLAALFTWITIVSLRSTAYVDQYGAVEGAGWLLALAPNALLLVRRVVPVAALVSATALYLAASATQGDSNAPLAIPFFAYSVAVTRPIRVSGSIVGGAALALSTATFYGPGDPNPLVIVVWFLLFGLGWLIGVTIRRNQARAEVLTQTVDDLEAQQAQIAATAIADERSRIARELHDAVGHAVNVMVLQAGAARLSNQPDKAFEALREIEDLGRSALTDLDQMLGLLRDDDAADRSPAKGIEEIPAMVAELQGLGADITLHNRCDRPVSRHIGAAAYRIVQEALTNALKHARTAHVDVSLSCTATHLEVSVMDDGAGRPAKRTSGGGRGIIGMTERAKVLGGHLSAGPVDGGGFGVRASLPLGPESSANQRATQTQVSGP
ncbi:MAG: sensor histidine kinase [Candidatus Nanopelagicales bacterium]